MYEKGAARNDNLSGGQKGGCEFETGSGFGVTLTVDGPGGGLVSAMCVGSTLCVKGVGEIGQLTGSHYPFQGGF